MALREWNSVSYLPFLSLRPAEMRALEELPNGTKDRLLPLVHLRPWVGSHQLHNATNRIEEAYGDRPLIVAMGELEPAKDVPVHAQLQALRSPSQGFRAWYDFYLNHDNYIPAVQLSEQTRDEERQIERLYSLERGLVVILEPPALPAADVIARRVGERTGGGMDVCFVVDFGLASRDHLQVGARATGYVRTIRREAPLSYAAISASSFPDSFVGLLDQPIYERRLFDTLGGVDNLIYSDRGSARVERQTGGGGQPAPRVDYPLSAKWDFFRSEDKVGFAGYKQQSVRLMRTESEGIWNPRLRVWGTQMIERTAVGDTSAISGAQKATATRINLHLHRQAYYSDPLSAEDTDEDWQG